MGMSLQVCVLGSGSTGNATVVASKSHAVLVDAGFSAKEIAQRMEEAGWSPDRLDAMLVSHEHGDHVVGLPVMYRRHKLPLYANIGTMEAVSANEKYQGLDWRIFSNGQPFAVGDLVIEPFSVPHDAYDPVGFRIQCGNCAVVVLTDIGVATNLVRQRLKDSDALVIECNHDVRMVNDAERPWYLKQRILGRQGHLSNEACADLLTEVASPRLKQIFLTHLSEDCNTPELALQTIERRLAAEGHPDIAVEMTWPDRVSARWCASKGLLPCTEPTS
jgi:phosphoribosyl 1,2-cyclic phosphodiesterase